MAIDVVAHHGVSIALACRTFHPLIVCKQTTAGQRISETCYRYSPMLSDEDEEIADWLERLATAWQGIENAREGANEKGPTSVPGALACALCICATFKAVAGTIRGFIPLADRRLQSNLPRSGSIASWS